MPPIPRRTRAWLLVAAAVALATLGAAPAVATTRPRLAVSPSRVHREGLVRVYGFLPGCPAGDQVTLISRAFKGTQRFAGVPSVSAVVIPGGEYRVQTRIPARRAPGRYTVTGRCGGGNLGVSVTLTVLR